VTKATHFLRDRLEVLHAGGMIRCGLAIVKPRLARIGKPSRSERTTAGTAALCVLVAPAAT